MTTHATEAAQLLDAKQCGWEVDWKRCGQPADRALVLGCVHEHLTPPLSTCESCAAAFAAELALGNMLCTPCGEHGSSTLVVVVREDKL